MQGLEGGAHLAGRCEGDDQRCVGPGEFDLGPDQGGQRGLGECLGDQVAARLTFERFRLIGKGGVAGGIERHRHRGLTDGADFGQAHAVGREHARERVEHDPGHAEGVGDQAGMLTARAAETVQHIAGDVVAALDRDRLDRLGHALNGDGDEAFGERFRRRVAARGAPDLGGQCLETGRHGGGVERLVAVRPED